MKIKTVKSNVPIINSPYFPQIFKFFVAKLKLLGKLKIVNGFLLLGVTKHQTGAKIFEKQQILLCPNC